MIKPDDIVYQALSLDDLNVCINNATILNRTITDRKDLHKRDELERFNNILMGEVAEMMVIKWLHSHGKFAISAVDKTSSSPDMGHDIEVESARDGKKVFCSIKSSISCLKDINSILSEFRLATKKSELREINIQVYFWLTLNPGKGSSRVSVPSLRQSAIIGWFGQNDLTQFTTYNFEEREAPSPTLGSGRKMKDLLKHLI